MKDEGFNLLVTELKELRSDNVYLLLKLKEISNLCKKNESDSIEKIKEICAKAPNRINRLSMLTGNMILKGKYDHV